MSNYLICGYGGIGQAIVKKLDRAGKHKITVLSSKPHPRGNKIRFLKINSKNWKNQDDFLRPLPDFVINTVGMLHSPEHQPEKTVNNIDDNWFLESMNINVLTTIHLTQALSQVMNRNSKINFINFSARIGSISDNKLGGWYTYRASKAALNMTIKTIAAEWRRNFPSSRILGYHPGTVNTKLSKPFQKNIKKSTLFSTSQAAEYLTNLLGNIDNKVSGECYDWREELIQP